MFSVCVSVVDTRVESIIKFLLVLLFNICRSHDRDRSPWKSFNSYDSVNSVKIKLVEQTLCIIERTWPFARWLLRRPSQWFAVNRDLTIFCAIVKLRIFLPWSVNFTDGRDPDLAIFCTVIRDKLYFQAVIRESKNDYRENSLFWQVSFEIPWIVNFLFLWPWIVN